MVAKKEVDIGPGFTYPEPQNSEFEIDGIGYRMTELNGHASRTLFLLALRAFGKKMIDSAKTGEEFAIALVDALIDVDQDKIDQMVAVVAPNTEIRVRAWNERPECAPIDTWVKVDWDKAFVGARSMQQFQVIGRHLTFNFGPSFLSAIESMHGSPKS